MHHFPFLQPIHLLLHQTEDFHLQTEIITYQRPFWTIFSISLLIQFAVQSQG